MSGVKEKISGWANRFRAELRRDKKKASMLVILMIAFGVMGGRFIITGVPPRDVAAGQSESEERLLPDAKPGSKHIAGAGRTALRPGQSDRQTKRQEYIAGMDRKITRDLFKPNPKYLPPAGVMRTRAASTDRKSGLLGMAAQWIKARSGAQRERKEQIEAIRAQAKALSLQSVMLGRSPTAVINGQVLLTGDWINGFRIKAISSDGCVVSKDGVDVELGMKK